MPNFILLNKTSLTPNIFLTGMVWFEKLMKGATLISSSLCLVAEFLYLNSHGETCSVNCLKEQIHLQKAEVQH